MLKTVTREDRGKLSALKPSHETEEGYLFFEGYATRAGVFPYRREDGSIQWELRPPEEVGNAASLKTLARKPVTDKHPPEFVNASNTDEYGKGQVDPEIVWEQDFEDGYVKVKGTVSRKDAVDSVKSGRRELSCGYTADLEMTSGVWTDHAEREHRFDAIQRNIRYNHLAIVDRGRAGRQACLRVDGIQLDEQEFQQLRETPMKIKIDGQEFDVSEGPAIQRAIAVVETSRADAVKRADAAEADLAQANDKIAELEPKAAELDVLKADEGNKPAPRTDAELEAERLDWANERFALIEVARRFKLDGFDKFEDVEGTNGDIKRQIVFSRFDESELPTDAHLDAAFALMMKEDQPKADEDGDDAQPSTKPKSTQPLAAAIATNEAARHDADADTVAVAQARYDAWVAGGCEGDLEDVTLN